jgi:3'-phosphoadenosine 5'-phosphosulfate sulfotransferase (PAPS reductase)/FAD synthetase
MTLGTKHVVGLSGGIDSQACARWVRNRFGDVDTILVNSDAGGNESPVTTEHLRYYHEKIHPVVFISPTYADYWKTPGFAESKGYDSTARLTFEEMIRLKGRPPSRKAQFCTEILKLNPQKRWLQQAFGPGGEFEGWDYVRYSGVRRDESGTRRESPFTQWDDLFDCLLNRPIADWTKKMCFDYVEAHGEEYNPLYKLGFGRVGCAPCINNGKEDILLWLERQPEMIDKIRSWEVSSGRTFFAPKVPGLATNTIDQVIEWAKTSRGGYQFRIMHERPSCESKYGLCE